MLAANFARMAEFVKTCCPTSRHLRRTSFQAAVVVGRCQLSKGGTIAHHKASLFVDRAGQAAYTGLQMRVGLLSDTHITKADKGLPPEIAKALHGVDLILHAGDIFIPSVLDELQRIAPVLAAAGDDDDGDIVADERVEQKHILKLQGQTLWLVHMRPPAYMSLSQHSSQSEGQDTHDAPDIVVFGHEHHTIVKRYGDVLFVNPGSPTLLHYRRGPGTVGILDIDSSQAEVHIRELRRGSVPL
jgi:putative phosphoesterase